MHVHILDLDGSVTSQSRIRAQAVVRRAVDWGPYIRMACSLRRFRRFERDLARSWRDREPAISFLGSGDFHHVSLLLLRRLQEPFNLLIIDNHPDWMRGVPFMHCGTWVYHASRLPLLGRIFHAGGDVDFDNYYQAMAPWRQLSAGKIVVLPAVRRFERRNWSAVSNNPLRPGRDISLTCARIEQMLEPFRTDLASRPLYVSLDKDVLKSEESIVNWDSGHLTLAEVLLLVRAFLEASGGRLAGMDIVGDWSPVRLCGWLRHFMHLTEHPALTIDPEEATRCNQRTNLALIECLGTVRNCANNNPC